jgi:hypothetical protein
MVHVHPRPSSSRRSSIVSSVTDAAPFGSPACLLGSHPPSGFRLANPRGFGSRCAIHWLPTRRSPSHDSQLGLPLIDDLCQGEEEARRLDAHAGTPTPGESSKRTGSDRAKLAAGPAVPRAMVDGRQGTSRRPRLGHGVAPARHPPLASHLERDRPGESSPARSASRARSRPVASFICSSIATTR